MSIQEITRFLIRERQKIREKMLKCYAVGFEDGGEGAMGQIMQTASFLARKSKEKQILP